MRFPKHAVSYSGMAVAVRAALPQTGSCPKEQVRTGKSFFDHSDVTTVSVVGATQWLVGWVLLPTVAVWPGWQQKGHEVALPPLPPLGWGGEWKETGKDSWVRIRAD